MPPHEKASVTVGDEADENHDADDAHTRVWRHDRTASIREGEERQADRKKENDVGNDDDQFVLLSMKLNKHRL